MALYKAQRKKSYSVVYRVNPDAEWHGAHRSRKAYTTLKEADKAEKRRLSISSPWENLLYQKCTNGKRTY